MVLQLLPALLPKQTLPQELYDKVGVSNRVELALWYEAECMSAGFESKTSCAFRTCVHCARLRFQIAWRRNIRSVLVVWELLRESAHCPLQRDCASDYRLDTVAASGSDPEATILISS